MKNIKLGVEIEAVLNENFFDLSIGGYHSGLPLQGLPHWTAERDGSLSHGNEFGGWEKCIELVSKPFTERNFFSGMQKFKDFFSKNGELKLNDVLKFNNSCGCHVHFSIDNFNFTNKVIFDVYPKVREVFIALMKGSAIKSKDEIIEHYGRSYSKVLTNESFESRLRDRHTEFNFCSESDNKGIEWRSPNMLNISTWDEFLEFFQIVFECLDFFYQNARKWKENWKTEMIESPYIPKLYDENLIVSGVRKSKIKYSRFRVPISQKINEEYSIHIEEGGDEDVSFELVD